MVLCNDITVITSLRIICTALKDVDLRQKQHCLKVTMFTSPNQFFTSQPAEDACFEIFCPTSLLKSGEQFVETISDIYLAVPSSATFDFYISLDDGLDEDIDFLCEWE